VRARVASYAIRLTAEPPSGCLGLGLKKKSPGLRRRCRASTQHATEALPPGIYSARASASAIGWGLVAHEHVWTRASCRLRLLSAPDAKAIEEVLSALQGCVVTKAEHQRLKPFDPTHEGWARYIAASVPVIDTSTGNQADLSALEAGSD
jgi:hypothetical protein